MTHIDNRKRVFRFIIAGTGVYALLLSALLWAESGQPDALIDTPAKALWYSLVTLTTVGYGDLYPMTPGGRLISTVFLLMSTGLLALLVGVAISAVTGRFFPQLRLWRWRRDRWYVFSADNAASRALAAHLTDGLVVFCNSRERIEGALSLALPPEALFELPYIHRGERCFFAMKDDCATNEQDAAKIKAFPVKVYYRGDGLGQALPENVIPFSDDECSARLYWQSRPWNPGGERVIIIGDGTHARAMLLHGLLTAPPDCTFHLFGDWTRWRTVHWALSDAPDLNTDIHFHATDWRAEVELLRTVDRIVLCMDVPEANREALSLLKRYYVVHGQVDARCAPGLQDAFCFGQYEMVFTPELVMKQALNRRARQMHEIYRSQADYPVPAWEELSDFLRRSNMAAADHMLTKARLLLPGEHVRELTPDVCARAAERFEAADDALRDRCRRIEHARWMLFHALNNWRYAPVRDNGERMHPLMVPYDQLDESEQLKDENAWKLLRALVDRGET